ncbi:MAG: hypothetical protein CML04_11440 [Pseudozobellia sp.]|nr:hypothetical protein [Pseudozobellia sp.]MBG50387.1 hypothetical protein [Pseudozobellia sp.]|tara:strand:- start:127390 stop:128574 length:1185 start_codon:yes stop_codon:yes gene_type:complete
MKRITLFVLLLLYISGYQTVFSQEENPDLVLTSKDSLIARSWHVGLGFNAVDDSGDMFDELFAVDSQWNFLPYPTRLNIGRYFKSGLGVEAIGTYNKYQVGKLIEGEINQEEKDYYAIDSRLTYDLMRIFGKDSWFDPYVGVGLGYTKADNVGRGTYNGVVGFRTWITENFGLDFNSTGKWRISNDNATNHLQHGVGVVYRFGIEKELTNEGKDKLERMLALEEEVQKQRDSIDQVEKEKARALADQLVREKALAEKRAEEEAKALEKQRKDAIRSKIDGLGNAYFNLNSSYLSTEAKKVLDGLAQIMKENIQLELSVSSFADSRGTAKYNKWLSERRVDRTIEYLVNAGVSESRLKGAAYGEENLVNECDDHTYCSEAKHQLNRRSEFTIIKF